jgi:glycosyltransferase involved in cell wall biosynthesis
VSLAEGFRATRERLGAKRRRLAILARRRRIGVHVWLRDNPYHEMIYRRFSDVEQPEQLTLLDDLEAFVTLPAAGRVLWLHCESSYSWGCRNSSQMAEQFRRYLSCLEAWVSKGGKLIWTMHDTGLHLADNDRSRIEQVRQLLAQSAEFVHVHSSAAARIASSELGVVSDRIVIVPHPTYAAVYDQYPFRRSVSDGAERRSLLFFGFIKAYKNLDGLAKALLSLPQGSFERLTIAGKKGTDFDLREEELSLKLTCDFRMKYIADEEVPALFGAAHFLVLPYTQSLTSGAAALSLGFGVPIIAPDLGGMREAIPEENHRLLYDPRDERGLQEALKRARDITNSEYSQLRAACEAERGRIHPDRVSAMLLDRLRN